MSKLYTGKGDDGTTGLFYGGRVPKDDDRPEAYGTVDEAQAAIGLARAATQRGGELDEMLTRLNELTDDVGGRFDFPTEFVVPGQHELAARLDVARTVVRRAERASVAVVDADDDSHVVPYLNRLSSFLWTAARWTEAGDELLSKTVPTEDR
jgi:cob(I)alamin adenosyltransferase